MSFWDDVKDMAGDAWDSKRTEMGTYLENVVTETFSRVQEPTKGNQTAVQLQQAGNLQTPRAATTAGFDYNSALKYGLPILAIGIAVLIFARRGQS